MNSFPARGYLYIAFGSNKFVAEAEVSVDTLRRVDRESHVTFVYEAGMDIDQEFLDRFDHVVSVADANTHEVSFKVSQMYKETPYEESLFVDTDTYFIDSCRPVFETLESYDMALAHATHDLNPAVVDGEELAACTPYNTGLFAFRRNEKVEDFFTLWNDIFRERYKDVDRRGADQPPFVSALAQCQARCCILSNLWNARFVYPETYDGLVKMLHGRHPDLKHIAEQINVSSDIRLWSPKIEACVYPGMSASDRQSARKYLSRRGLAALKRFDFS